MKMKSAKQIIILGTGGNCIDILDTLLSINEAEGETWQCKGFLDDNPALQNQSFYGYPVLGPLTSAQDYKDCWFVNGIGSAGNFWKKPAIIALTGLPIERFATLVHPSASVSRFARLGHGTVIFQHVTVTSNASLGTHVIVLPHAVISHDSSIGDYTCITAGVCVSGNVKVGRACYLGTNAALHGHIQIDDFVQIGMGSVVRHDIPRGSIVVGNPAYLLRQLENLPNLTDF